MGRGTYRISPLAKVMLDPWYDCLAVACWIVKSRYPFASSAVELGVSRPDPGMDPTGDLGADDIVVSDSFW